MDELLEKAYETLKVYRTRKDLKMRPCRYLKETFTHFDGTERPLEFRYYQVQGILHLIGMNRFLLGDEMGLGKTIQTISALCYLWEKDPTFKAVVVTDKSAVLQWGSEFDKFTKGISTFTYNGPKKGRQAALEAFQACEGPSVLILNYALLRIDFSVFQEALHDPSFVIIYDEAQAFKGTKSQIYQACRYFSSKAQRCWALTATMIQNRLMEGYAIYTVIVPGLFSSERNFMNTYGIVEQQSIPGRHHKISVVVGHTPEHIEMFREKIDPFYLGRAKWEVASELPSLTIKTVEVDLSPLQETKYKEALAGLLEMGDGEVKETTKLTQIIYCQQIINHPELIGVDADLQDCPRLETLLDLLIDGEFAGQKVIVSTRFRKMVDIIERELKKRKVGVTRITGNENDKQRQAAMKAFQDLTSPIRIVLITDAAKQAVNLQAASAIIFYDTDFSGGVYLQKLGRMIRIGSVHSMCYAVHLAARRRSGGKTIDQRCMDILKKKMVLIESVLGKRLMGEGDTPIDIGEENDIASLFASLREDANS